MIDQIHPRFRGPIRALGALVVAVVAAYAVAVALGHGVDAAAGYVDPWTILVEALAIGAIALRVALVREDRGAWTAIGVGLILYTAGTASWAVLYQPLDPPPYPSPADVLWLAFYPAAYAALFLLARGRLPRMSRTLMLDGLLAGLAMTALATAALGPAVVRNAEGLSGLAKATTFAYPLADLMLLGVMVFIVVVTGWRPGRALAVLGLGLLCVTAADALWSYQLAGLVGGNPGISNLLWTIAWGCVGFAAWQDAPRRETAVTGRLVNVIPMSLATLSMILLVADHFVRLTLPTVLLAALTGILAVARAVLSAAEERAFAESRRQAMTDELTGLPNRRAFLGRLAEAIEGAREQGAPVALMMIDLDRFKELNDTLGHAAGDDLLAALGPRLREALGRRGRLARLGGDEFGVVLSAPSGAEQARRVADDLAAALDHPFELRGLRVSVGASIGIGLYPLHAASGEELLQRADVAMYQAKRSGSGVELYVAERDRSSRDRLVLAADLRHAIQEDLLSVVFQPKAELHSGDVGAVEALVRWKHHSHGPIPPDQFVPLAEQTGLARALTSLVLERSVRQLARWRSEGQDLRVAVNVCAADLCDEAFPADVRRVLARHGVAADRLQIEVTENTVLADPVRANHVLERLVDLGVELSLDDFGTGHSSLTHLRRLPVREIKLDRSFVAAMTSSSQDAAIVHSTIELAGRLGLRVVAEGVEDEPTWAMLRDLGCDQVQGYLLSPPVPPDELTAWLAARHDVHTALPAIQDALRPGR